MLEWIVWAILMLPFVFAWIMILAGVGLAMLGGFKPNRRRTRSRV